MIKEKKRIKQSSKNASDTEKPDRKKKGKKKKKGDGETENGLNAQT